MHAPTTAPGLPRSRLVGPGIRIAVMVALAHALNDAYAAFLHPLLPRIMDHPQSRITELLPRQWKQMREELAEESKDAKAA